MDKEKFTAELQDNYAIVTHQMNTALTTMQLLLEYDEITHRKELQSELVSLKRYVDIIVPFLQVQDMPKEISIQTLSIDYIVKQVLRKSALLFVAKENSLALQSLNSEVVSNEKWLTLAIELAIFSISNNSKKDTISIYMDKSLAKRLVIENHSNRYIQEDIEAIIEQGYSGAETKKEKQATGIELYLCYQILTNLSHNIHITTNNSSGIKITIQF